ncbi:hypothetical protein MLD38_017750 [Melastoma candidum]|uniref:Uncharacterized protein n=1 Tax=Melastoma candidum TaxID=119954 RepID=A0ACB9QZX2_9MYRT|nr:hypothetical protein MLD38_017750 [Melastoma candidum]
MAGDLLSAKLSGLGISDGDYPSPSPSPSHNQELTQVMVAVEAAEATIKHQNDENIRLKAALQDKIRELERYKAYGLTTLNQTAGVRDKHFYGNYEAHRSALSVGNPDGSSRRVGDTPLHDQGGTIIVQGLQRNNNSVVRLDHEGIGTENSKINGTLEVIAGPQAPAENSGFSPSSSPSAASFYPNRYQTEGEYDRRLNYNGASLMQVAEVDSSVSLHKQDLVQKVQEQEQEIIQLKHHLTDYSIKEAQICNEKYVLDKRIAYMRMAFDQQQQDLVDAASKSLSYRQDIMEENIRLSYQAAQQERLMFVSSLLPLLAEYSLQPPVPDAQSIVSNVKVLFKHLQEKLNITEYKLKESQFQFGAWSSDFNPSTFALQSPVHLNKNGLELVPQQMISHGNVAVTSSAAPATAGWDLLNHHQATPGTTVSKSMDHDDLGLNSSPVSSRNNVANDMPVTYTQGRGGRYWSQSPAGNRATGNTVYTAGPDDPNSSYSPYLPPVLEEPSSSFSDAADDDPFPAIEGLQISNDPFPGTELLASGYSINGTTSCNFEWVRHLEDGSVNYIDGAKQPTYLVTADDVDTYLAIEVQPLDDRKRKKAGELYGSLIKLSVHYFQGELVKVFANDHRKITCDSEMQQYIGRTLQNGHASFKISLSMTFLHIWEPGILAIKREGYSIKCSSGVVATEKFSPTTSVTIPYGYPWLFSIKSSNGEEHLLSVENGSTDIPSPRDTIVLILRLFIMRAGEKKKGKKRGIFF